MIYFLVEPSMEEVGDDLWSCDGDGS